MKNRKNDKCYIGQTHRLKIREQAHRSGRCRCIALENAINKYGQVNFDFIVLEKCINQKELDERERYWINMFSTLIPFGYNIKEGGVGGGPCPQSVKDKISKANTGKKRTPEQIERMRQRRIGKKHSDETKQKLREINLGKKMSPQAIEKTRQFWIGRKHSEEAKHKMSESSKGFKHTEESKKKIKEVLLGRKYSQETLKRMRASVQIRAKRSLTRQTCKHGHEMTEENTYRPPGKLYQRQCRACIRINAHTARETIAKW